MNTVRTVLTKDYALRFNECNGCDVFRKTQDSFGNPHFTLALDMDHSEFKKVLGQVLMGYEVKTSFQVQAGVPTNED